MIKKEMVFIHENLSTRDDVIHFIAQKALAYSFITETKRFIEVVFERENEISTSVGHDIAIPHGKSEVIKEAFVAYVRTSQAFEWDENTKDSVQSIFLIGVPEKDTGMTHLRYISQVSKKLINDEFREALFACKTAEEAFVLLDAINDGMKEK